MSEFVVKFWYPEVVDDLSKLIQAIEYYNVVWLRGQRHSIAKGKLEWLMQEQPDTLRTYQDVFTDAAMVHKWLDEQIKYEKAKKRRWYLGPEARQEYGEIRKTDVDMYVQSDSDIKSLIDLQLMVELHKKALENCVQSIEKRGIMLTNISKIRIAGQHEAFIDSTHETRVEEI